jgi:hypothetical protein
MAGSVVDEVEIAPIDYEDDGRKKLLGPEPSGTPTRTPENPCPTSRVPAPRTPQGGPAST